MSVDLTQASPSGSLKLRMGNFDQTDNGILVNAKRVPLIELHRALGVALKRTGVIPPSATGILTYCRSSLSMVVVLETIRTQYHRGRLPDPTALATLITNAQTFINDLTAMVASPASAAPAIPFTVTQVAQMGVDLFSGATA